MVSCWSNAAEARDGPSGVIDIAAARLPTAIAELSEEAGVSIGAEGRLPDLPTPAIHGRMSVAKALSRLLRGTGYVARRVGSTAWRIEKAAVRRNHGSAKEAGQVVLAPGAVAAEPIVVTASKRSSTLDDLPMAVAVVQLDRNQADMPTSGTAVIAGQTEGFAMTSLGPGRNRMYLRGVADSPFTGETQSTVAVLLDETRLTFSAPDPDIRLVDVERVEVLKGPQGSLYGTGALGGIYHVVTHRADLDDSSLAVSASADNVAHGGTGLSGSAIGNLPIVRGAAALRLVGYSADEAGWLDTGDRRDSNSSQLLGARANLAVEPGGGWRADLSGLIQLLESRDSRYVYSPGARVRPAQQSEPHDNDVRHLAARLTRKGDGADITLSTGMTWHEVDDTLDATVGAGGFGVASPSLFKDERAYRLWDSEARIDGGWGRWRWLIGLSHVEARQDATPQLQSFTGPTLIIDDNRRETHETALFGDVSIPLGRSWNLDAGARLFRSSTKETHRLLAGPATTRRNRNGITPSVALSWKPRPNELIFIRYASAYRQGDSDVRPGGEIIALKSDELETLEAGWRRSIGQDAHLVIGLFASRWSNLQSDMLLDNGLIESGNAGDARILGAEVSADAQLGADFRLEGGANFTNARLVRNMLGTDLDDRRLPVVPRFAARAKLTQYFTLAGEGAQISAAVRYVGPQRLSFDPDIDRPMGSYFETRIEAQARLGRFRVSAAADNLIGGSYDNFAFGNSLRFATTRQYTPQRPASVSIGLMTEF